MDMRRGHLAYEKLCALDHVAGHGDFKSISCINGRIKRHSNSAWEVDLSFKFGYQITASSTQ